MKSNLYKNILFVLVGIIALLVPSTLHYYVLSGVAVYITINSGYHIYVYISHKKHTRDRFKVDLQAYLVACFYKELFSFRDITNVSSVRENKPVGINSLEFKTFLHMEKGIKPNEIVQLITYKYPEIYEDDYVFTFEERIRIIGGIQGIILNLDHELNEYWKQRYGHTNLIKDDPFCHHINFYHLELNENYIKTEQY